MVVGPSLVIIRGDSESSRNVPLGVPESLGSNCGFPQVQTWDQLDGILPGPFESPGARLHRRIN
jgi:hypothetical protein